MCSTLVVQMKGKSTVISLKMESFRIGGGDKYFKNKLSKQRQKKCFGCQKDLCYRHLGGSVG